MIYTNRQYSEETMKRQDSKDDKLAAMVEKTFDQIETPNYLPDKKDSPKAQDPTTGVSPNNKY